MEELIAQHRPYGLDCKCGRPINSDADWARHLIEVLDSAGYTRKITHYNLTRKGSPQVIGKEKR